MIFPLIIFQLICHLGFDFFETSAKENLNVSQSFDRWLFNINRQINIYYV